MRIQRKLLNDALTLAALFFATGALHTFIVDPSDPLSATNGSPFIQLSWLIIYGAVALRLIPRYRQIIMLVRANKCLMLLVLLAIFSALWSQDPSLTLRHGLPLLATTFIGIDFAIRYSIRDQLRLVCIVLGLVVLLGIVAQLFFPKLVPNGDFNRGDWHGVFGFKNDWARIVVLATVAALSRSRRSLRDLLAIASLVLIAFGLIALARSAGALVIFVVMLLLFKICDVALRWRPKVLAVAGLTGVLMVLPMSYLLAQNLDRATAVLGRDASLSGRVNIWELALSSIANSPVLGYGYSAFWEASSQRAARIREEMHWAVPHAHNGYVDMTLELGLTGLSLLIASYVIAARRAFDCWKRGAERETIWPLAYLSFFLLYQFTEGSLVTGNLIFWILYVAASFSVTRVTVTDPQSDRQFIAPRQMFPLDEGTVVTADTSG